MKKLILALVLIFAFALPVLAAPVEISGTFTTEAEYDFLGTFDLVDTTEVTVLTAINDTTTAEATLTINELIFGTVGLDVSGKLCFDLGDDETAEIGVDIDLLTYDLAFGGEYLGFTVADDIVINTKAKYQYPASTYYGIVTLISDFNEDMDLMVEARTDSDGAEALSFEAQISYDLTEDIEVMIGVEMNDWADDINDWDACEIVGDTDKVYGKLVVNF